MNLIHYFEKRKLLSNGSSNTKTAKNSLPTYYLSLQPTNLNSKNINLCKFSTKECRAQCLQFSGRQGFSNVVKSRTNKTEFFVQHEKEFLEKLWNELEDINKKHAKAAVRLNLLSDINWDSVFSSKLGKNMSSLKNIQFYKYLVNLATLRILVYT